MDADIIISIVAGLALLGAVLLATPPMTWYLAAEVLAIAIVVVYIVCRVVGCWRSASERRKQIRRA